MGLLQKRKTGNKSAVIEHSRTCSISSAILVDSEKCTHAQLDTPFSNFCNFPSQLPDVNSSDTKGRSVLYWCVKRSLLDVAMLLLEEGVILLDIII